MKVFLVRHIALTALLAVCAVVFAQNGSNDSTYVISEVEVIGVSSGDLRSLVPQYSIASADFKRLNITDITSAFRRLPGVTLRDYGGAGGMKTVAVRGFGSQHTGVALDGLLLPDAQSGQIDLQQFQLPELSSLALSVAGDDNIFQPARNFSRSSLVSITTADSIVNSLSLEAGSWGYLSPSVRLGKNIGKVNLSLQSAYTRADNDYPFTVENGVETHRERRNNSSLSQGNINASVAWNFNPYSTWRTFLRLYDNDRELPGLVRLYNNENDETLRDRGSLVQSLLTTRLADAVWLKSAIRWNWTEQKYHIGIPSGGIKSEQYIQREYYATASVLYQPTSHLDFDYSLDAFHNSMTTTLAGNPSPTRTSWLQSIAGKWKSERFNVIAQLLNSNIDDEHRLSPSVSASFKPFSNKNLLLRLAAKDIFRMPSMTELYYYHIGSPSLKPEKTQQLNLGITHSGEIVNGMLNGSLTCDIYINKVSDKIVAIPFNMFVWRYMNLTKVLGRGADVTASLDYRMNTRSSLSFTSNYSYQRIGMREVIEKFHDYQIPYTPIHSGSATLAWINPWVNCSATLSGASKQWTNNEHNGDALPAYREVALSLYRSFSVGKRQSVDVRLVVQNLLNEEYCLIAHYPMPGRNVKMNITYKF